MVIRRRLGGVICLIPYILILQIGVLLNNRIIIGISFLLMIIGIIFSSKLYDFFLLDSNSTSPLFAGNMALQYGFSPKGQNGELWNPNELTVSEVYGLYKQNRKKSPVEGTAGFLFYTTHNGKKANKIEFYDYRSGGEIFTYYEFYFHSYNKNGDKISFKEKRIDEIKSNMIFVSLEKL